MPAPLAIALATRTPEYLHGLVVDGALRRRVDRFTISSWCAHSQDIPDLQRTQWHATSALKARDHVRTSSAGGDSETKPCLVRLVEIEVKMAMQMTAARRRQGAWRPTPLSTISCGSTAAMATAGSRVRARTWHARGIFFVWCIR